MLLQKQWISLLLWRTFLSFFLFCLLFLFVSVCSVIREMFLLLFLFPHKIIISSRFLTQWSLFAMTSVSSLVISLVNARTSCVVCLQSNDYSVKWFIQEGLPCRLRVSLFLAGFSRLFVFMLTAKCFCQKRFEMQQKGLTNRNHKYEDKLGPKPRHQRKVLVSCLMEAVDRNPMSWKKEEKRESKAYKMQWKVQQGLDNRLKKRRTKWTLKTKRSFIDMEGMRMSFRHRILKSCPLLVIDC